MSNNAMNACVASLPGAKSSGYSEEEIAHRKVLSIAVGCVLQEAGCTSVEKAVVGTLVEILQSSELSIPSPPFVTAPLQKKFIQLI